MRSPIYSLFLLKKINTKIGTLISFELCFVCFFACGAIGGLSQVSKTKVRAKPENVNSLVSTFCHF